jgi:hypothetical protein
LVITIPNLEIFLFCQHNSTGGGNLKLRQIMDVAQNVSFVFRRCVLYCNGPNRFDILGAPKFAEQRSSTLLSSH